MPYTTIDQTIADVAHRTTYGGAGLGVGGWLMSAEFVALIGIVCAVVGLAVNIAFRWRDDVRRRTLHEAQMDEIRRRASRGGT